MGKKNKQKIDWKLVATHLGKPITVHFDDHATGLDVIPINVCGYLAKLTPKHISVVSWDCPTLEGPDRLNNIEAVSILKSTIINIAPLRRAQKWG